MAYCPQCLTEYVESATECMDCHVPLNPGSPPASANTGSEPKLVRLRVFSGPTAVMEADLAKNLLQENNILSFIPGETSAEILPGIDVVQLWVREEDVDHAAEILQSYLDVVNDSIQDEDTDEDVPFSR
jgi:Putative prokaryotic signal transducing protein